MQATPMIAENSAKHIQVLSGCEEVEHCTLQLPTTSQLHSPTRILPRSHTNIRIHTHTTMDVDHGGRGTNAICPRRCCHIGKIRRILLPSKYAKIRASPEFQPDLRLCTQRLRTRLPHGLVR